MTAEAALPATARRRTALATVATPFGLSLVFLAAVVVLAALAPLLPLPAYTAMSANRLAAPSAAHWFGTDQFGRDLFVRVLFGLRTSLLVGAVGVVASTVLGVLLGLVAGYRGGAIDTLVMRFLDALLAFPSLLLAIGVAAVMGPGALSAAVALGIVGVPQMARITRAGTLSERSLQYVEAAESIGTSGALVLFRHILPNIAHLVLVQMVLFFVVAVLTEAGLSFLGLGVQVPLPSLGSMLDDARAYLGRAPWYAIAPGATLALVVLALNLAADGLRDRLDPRS
ncbi:MAG TPA: ABC transporter permease [Bauldia sp.]|nr:ABC transporter permease [Bauldia sp.]